MNQPLQDFYRVSPRPGKPLRVGLLLEGTTLPRWAVEVVSQLQQAEYVDLALVVLNDASEQRAAAPRRGFFGRIAHVLLDARRRRLLLHALYARWDRRHVTGEHPSGAVDASRQLAGIETISVKPLVSRFVHRFPPEAVEALRARDLDVLVRFGFNILRGDVLQAARYGIWSWHHGDNDFFRGGPHCLWEIVERTIHTGAILQVLTEELDAGVVLCKGLFPTTPTLSVELNRVQPLWGASTFLIRKLRELHAYGWSHVQAHAVPPAPYQGRRKIYATPGNADMIRWLVPRLARKVLSRLFRRPTVGHWKLAFREGHAALPLRHQEGLDRFQWVRCTPGSFFADPFLVTRDGRRWVFFEEYLYAQNRGRISYAEVVGAAMRDPGVALDLPYHLSYPFLFEADGATYMIPESLEVGRVDLFRSTAFPAGWTFERTLLELTAVDSTLLWRDGRYWLFTTVVEPRSDVKELWLFSAPALDAAWEPHPSNPISTDTRYARGAGPVIEVEGRLLRPSQDGGGGYGRTLVFNEVEELTPTRYRERPFSAITGTAFGKDGVHTYSRDGALEVIDGKSRERPVDVLSSGPAAASA